MNWYKQAMQVALEPEGYVRQPTNTTLSEICQGLSSLLHDKYALDPNHIIARNANAPTGTIEISCFYLNAESSPQLVSDIQAALEELGVEAGSITTETHRQYLDKNPEIRQHNYMELFRNQNKIEIDINAVSSIFVKVTRNHNEEALEMERAFNEDPPPRVLAQESSILRLIEGLYNKEQWKADGYTQVDAKKLQQNLSAMLAVVEQQGIINDSPTKGRIRSVLSLCNWCVEHGYPRIRIW